MPPVPPKCSVCGHYSYREVCCLGGKMAYQGVSTRTLLALIILGILLLLVAHVA